MGVASDKKKSSAAQAPVDLSNVPAELTKSISQIEWDNLVQKNFKASSVRVKTVHVARMLTQDTVHQRNWSQEKFDGIFALVGRKTGNMTPAIGKKGVRYQLINFEIQMLDLNGKLKNTEYLYKTSSGNGKFDPMEIINGGSSIQFYGQNGIKCYRFCSPEICKKVRTKIKQILHRDVFVESNMKLMAYEDIKGGDEVGKLYLGQTFKSTRRLKAAPTQAPSKPPSRQPTNTKPAPSHSNPASPKPAKFNVTNKFAPAHIPIAPPEIKSANGQVNTEKVQNNLVASSKTRPAPENIAPTLKQDVHMPPVPLKPPSLPHQPSALPKPVVKPVTQPSAIPKPVVKPVTQPSPIPKPVVKPVTQPSPIPNPAVKPVTQPSPIPNPAVKAVEPEPGKTKDKKNKSKFKLFGKSKPKESSSSQISTPPPSMPPPAIKKPAPIAPPPPSAPAMSAPSTPCAPSKHQSIAEPVPPQNNQVPPPPPSTPPILAKPPISPVKEPENSPSTPDSSRTNLLESIRQGTVLKRIDSEPVTDNTSNSPRGDLLQSIRCGTVLKKAKTPSVEEEKAAKNDGSVFGKLTEQLNQMRTAGGLGQADESSVEEDDSDW